MGMGEALGWSQSPGLGAGSGLLYHTVPVTVSGATVFCFQDKLGCGEFVFYKAAVGFVNQVVWCWSILSAGIL